MAQYDLTDADIPETGLASIDAQHKQLFTISNDLVNAIARGEGETVLKEIFDRLKEYTEFHFKDEEAYMKEIGYPELSPHAAAHALLLVRVNTLWRLIQGGDKISPKGVSLFIADWIVDHIMEKDAHIGTFAKTIT